MAHGFGSHAADIIMSQQIPGSAPTWQQALGGLAQGLMAGYVTRSEREQELAARQQEYQLEMAKAQALADAQFQRDRELRMMDLTAARENRVGDREFEMSKLGKQHEYKLNENQQSLLMDLQKLQTSKALDAQYAPSIAGASEAAKLAAQQRYGALPGQAVNAKAAEEARQGELLMDIAQRYRGAVDATKGTSGSLGGIKSTANKLLSSLGIGNQAGTSELEAQARFDALSADAVKAYKLPGDPMTAAEIQALKSSALPGMNRTYEQNLAAIQELENKAKFMMRTPAGQAGIPQPQAPAAQPEAMPDLSHLSTEQLMAIRSRLAGGQ